MNIIRLDKNNFTENVWGGRWIPDLKNFTLPPSKKIGESWEFSTHPRCPSRVVQDGINSLLLSDLLAKNGQAILGRDIVEKYGPTAPFLLKFIDPEDDLSLQVHPTAKYANQHEQESGKTESWFILDVGDKEGDGFIYLGFKEPEKDKFLKEVLAAKSRGASLDPQVRAESASKILPFVNKVKVKPGEVYHIPPGTIHGLGRGVRIFEIQETSDITYRIWDWNRPAQPLNGEASLSGRPLHVAQAMEVLDFAKKSAENFRVERSKIEFSSEGKIAEVVLIKNKFYSLNLIESEAKGSWIETKLRGRFQVLTTVIGSVEIDQEIINAGETVILPAANEAFRIKILTKQARILKSYI